LTATVNNKLNSAFYAMPLGLPVSVDCVEQFSLLKLKIHQ